MHLAETVVDLHSVTSIRYAAIVKNVQIPEKIVLLFMKMQFDRLHRHFITMHKEINIFLFYILRCFN